jgi:hypothetical protein
VQQAHRVQLEFKEYKDLLVQLAQVQLVQPDQPAQLEQQDQRVLLDYRGQVMLYQLQTPAQTQHFIQYLFQQWAAVKQCLLTIQICGIFLLVDFFLQILFR